jgi:DNA-binding NarL/FixJ family response regulator
MSDLTPIITILYADDNSEMRTAVRRELEKEADLEILAEASSGEQALELASQTDPDIILLDLEMPGMNGLETARRLLQEGQRAKILLYCSEVDLDTREQIKSLGIAGLLEKGGNPWNFANSIRQAAAGEDI